MSAFDIAGAVVWTPLAVMMWLMVATRLKDAIDCALGGVIAVACSLASIFCFARLFGASL
jgi:hypothetical protein